MRFFKFLSINLLTAVLLWLAWIPNYFTPAIFIAFIPLLWVADREERPWVMAIISYIGFLLFNVGTGWWIGNTPVPISGVAANLLNAGFMTIPIIGYSRFKRRFRQTPIALTGFVVFWLCFEWLHQQWEFTFPWFNLGNVFANQPSWVQWYAIVGAGGGSAWILLVNVSIYQLIQQSNRQVTAWSYPLLMVIIPILGSIFYWNSFVPEVSSKPSGDNVVVVQPNIDPYTEKFNQGAELMHLEKMLRYAEQKLDTHTRFVLLPETALYDSRGIDEGNWQSNPLLVQVHYWLLQHPKVQLVSGVDSYRWLAPGEKTAAMRKAGNSDTYYETYNAAISLNSEFSPNVYHKSKLVPGVEHLPYLYLFRFMQHLVVDMGGTSGSLGKGKEPIVFSSKNSSLQAAPIICYESIFPDYVAQYVQKGANFLAILTNDGWWGNSPGHIQHFAYARLRAIENRMWVARSANTGISGFIDPYGRVIQSLGYEKGGALKQSIEPSKGSIFSKTGDWISKLSLLITLGIILYSFYLRFNPQTTQ